RMVGAYRDTEVQPEGALSLLLADLAQAGLATHRTLAPLTPDEAGQLVDDLLTGRGDERTGLREQVVQRAGGVPFVLVSCAQALGEAEYAQEGPQAVPWDVAQGVRQRVAA